MSSRGLYCEDLNQDMEDCGLLWYPALSSGLDDCFEPEALKRSWSHRSVSPLDPSVPSSKLGTKRRIQCTW